MEENFSEYQRAVLMGRVLAENGFTVCTGGYGGIMEAVARGAKQVGGKTIAIVAKELGISVKTILRWERAGKIRKAPRDWRGWRVYGPEDIETLKGLFETVYQ